MNNITFKKYESADESKIALMTEPLYYEIFKNFSKKTVSLITRDSEVVGWFHLHLPESSLYSGFVFIYIAVQYRRNGIGTYAYKKCEEQLRAIGCNRWSSYPESEASDRFALSVGFDYTNTNSYLVHSGELVAGSAEGIRKCRVDDYPTAPDIWSKEYAAMHRRIGLPYERKELSAAERKEEFEEFCNNIDNYFVLEADGKLVGMGSLFEDSSGIGALAVDSAYAGKGYGTRLAIFMTNECIRRTGKAPCIYCESGNDDAMHIYKKIGYVEKNRESVAFKK